MHSAATLGRYTRLLHLVVTFDRYTWSLHLVVTLGRYDWPLHSTAILTRPSHFKQARVPGRALRGAHNKPTAAGALVPPHRRPSSANSKQHFIKHATDQRHTQPNKPSKSCEAIRVAQAGVGHDGSDGAVAGHGPDHHTSVQSAARKPLAPAYRGQGLATTVRQSICTYLHGEALRKGGGGGAARKIPAQFFSPQEGNA